MNQIGTDRVAAANEVVQSLLEIARKYEPHNPAQHLAIVAAMYETDAKRARREFSRLGGIAAEARAEAHQWWLIAEERRRVAHESEDALRAVAESAEVWKQVAIARERQVKDLEAIVQEFLNSRSWRYTRFLRRENSARQQPSDQATG